MGQMRIRQLAVRNEEMPSYRAPHKGRQLSLTQFRGAPGNRSPRVKRAARSFRSIRYARMIEWIGRRRIPTVTVLGIPAYEVLSSD
jgi:hypothetical protein